MKPHVRPQDMGQWWRLLSQASKRCASLALAENVAGVGSSALCPGCACVGIEVSGSHVQAVVEGDTVTACAHLQHRGNTLHVWQVDISNSAGELISTVRVTNYIIKQKK